MKKLLARVALRSGLGLASVVAAAVFDRRLARRSLASEVGVAIAKEVLKPRKRKAEPSEAAATPASTPAPAKRKRAAATDKTPVAKPKAPAAKRKTPAAKAKPANTDGNSESGSDQG